MQGSLLVLMWLYSITSDENHIFNKPQNYGFDLTMDCHLIKTRNRSRQEPRPASVWLQ